MTIDTALRAEVEKWITEDPDAATRSQLQEMLDSGDETSLRSCFAGFLEFGTAGLRGPLGPGPSRMNRAVVTKTAAGLAIYMKRNGLKSVVIGRDARYGSEDFTRDTAEIMHGAGFEVFVLPRPLPTPVLAYAVRNLKCDVGIMVTASHNPPQDNGYKVYLGGTVGGVRYEGSQIISPADSEISADIAAVPALNTLVRSQGWTILDESHIDAYVSATSRLATKPGTLTIVYTAMHGVGTETLEKVFKAAGFPAPTLVSEQAQPDPDFPTVKFPNPEEPGAIDLSLVKAREVSADLVIANDPDADRCAAAIKDRDGQWRMLRGDEVGALLGDYMARKAPNKEVMLANSIVSSSILSKIAQHYGLPFKETLTGFKWLAKIPNLWFGYEEALGYAVDSKSVNDKDGISAALVLAQLATDLKAEGKTLVDLLDEIWERHGYHGTKQISVRTTNVAQIDAILSKFRDATPATIGRFSLTAFDDLEKPQDGLPPTNGVRIRLMDNIRIIVRPSGTEPKIKCYIEVITKDRATSEKIIAELEKELHTFLS
ncbi:MAG: phospho-sugar mutase [Candidatus Nanopelagicaceae bacterium]